MVNSRSKPKHKKVTPDYKRILIAVVSCLCLLMPVNANAADMIDVSSWQSGINVTSTGAQIVVAKATQGTSYVNPDCDRVVQSALSAGQGVGVYDFADTSVSAKAEAAYFNQHTSGYRHRGIVPILDWEPMQSWNVSWALTWLQEVEKVWGVKPIIYMNQYTENSYDWSSVVAGDYGLWIAAYTNGYTPIYGFNPPSSQPHMNNWGFAVAWQYTSTGYVNGWGGALDLSVVYGDLDTWYAYAGSRPEDNGSGSAIDTPIMEPAKPTEKPNTSCKTECVTVKSGDYVSKYWADYWNVSVPSGDVNRIYAGDVICHNGSSSNLPTHSHFYTVKAGDTLIGISSAYGISYTQIQGYSSGNPNLIYAGEVVYW